MAESIVSRYSFATWRVRRTDGTGDDMKRYKYQALVHLLPGDGDAAAAPPMLPAGTCRMVIKAEHRETHVSKMFSSLVTRDDTVGLAPEAAHGARDAAVSVTFVV